MWLIAGVIILLPFLHKVNIHIPDYLTTSYMEAQSMLLNNGSTNAELINAWNTAPMLGGCGSFLICLHSLLIFLSHIWFIVV